MNLDAIYKRLSERSRTAIGLPLDQSPFPWINGTSLEDFLDHKINNLGDPFQPECYGVNTFAEERELVREVGELFHLDDPWGYVTDCGSTGNLAGIRAGLERFPDAVVYASDRVHCSVDKACRLARAKLVKVPSRADHSINVDYLRSYFHRGRSGIFVLTAGTVMAGAIDDIEAVIEDMRSQPTVQSFYYHVDAALAGFMLPYVGGPAFGFPCGIDSISVSGHKMLGVPIPCGLFISRHKPDGSAEYGTSQCATVGGSRSGLAALLMLHALQHYGPRGMSERTGYCLDHAACLMSALSRIGWPSEHVSVYSNIVMLKKPSQAVCDKWQLAWEGNTAHVVAMPHLTTELIDEFVTDLKGEAS